MRPLPQTVFLEGVLAGRESENRKSPTPWVTGDAVSQTGSVADSSGKNTYPRTCAISQVPSFLIKTSVNFMDHRWRCYSVWRSQPLERGIAVDDGDIVCDELDPAR